MKLCVSLFIDYVDPLLWQERMRRLVLVPAVGRNKVVTNLLRMIQIIWQVCGWKELTLMALL